MRTLIGVVVLTVISGCMTTANLPAVQYYVLDNRGVAGSVQRMARGGAGVLLVQPASASPFYDTQRLVYSSAPGQRAYYQFAAWTARPARALSDLLQRRVEQGGVFASVASTTAGVKGDLVLNVRLEEFYHDTAERPGRVRIEVSTELIDAGTRTVTTQRRFAHSVVTNAENAPAAVDAANRAVTAVIDDIASWVERSSKAAEAT